MSSWHLSSTQAQKSEITNSALGITATYLKSYTLGTAHSKPVRGEDEIVVSRISVNSTTNNFNNLREIRVQTSHFYKSLFFFHILMTFKNWSSKLLALSISRNAVRWLCLVPRLIQVSRLRPESWTSEAWHIALLNVLSATNWLTFQTNDDRKVDLNPGLYFPGSKNWLSKWSPWGG